MSALAFAALCALMQIVQDAVANRLVQPFGLTAGVTSGRTKPYHCIQKYLQRLLGELSLDDRSRSRERREGRAEGLKRSITTSGVQGIVF